MKEVFEGYYVTKDGKVFSSKSGELKEMAQSIDQWNYRKVSFRVNKKTKTVRVHTLVAEAYLGPRPPGYEINHIDGDKHNNHVSNLEYVIPGDNLRHAYAIGSRKYGEQSPNAKLTDAQWEEIKRRRRQGETIASLAKEYGISPGYISSVLNGKKRTRTTYMEAPETVGKAQNRKDNKRKLSDLTCADMIIEVLNGLSVDDASNKYGITPETVRRIMRKDIRHNAWALVPLENTYEHKTPVILDDEVWASIIRRVLQGESRKDIANEYNVNIDHVNKVMQKKRRPKAWELVEGAETIENTCIERGSE